MSVCEIKYRLINERVKKKFISVSERMQSENFVYNLNRFCKNRVQTRTLSNAQITLPIHLMVGCFPLEEVIGVRVPDRQLEKIATFMWLFSYRATNQGLERFAI